ncbi:hypothetical protein [Streptomyces sp. NPDC005438]|uniref:hypothetical protein n=1 Tax=Streptomyces sp. NPDC005438 TaxID=3156880 RepID=UPI00339E3024
MHPSAGPSLPHTRSRPAHWAGTLLAVAAVLGLAASLQPSDAKARQSGAGKGPTASSPGPDPRTAHYPLDCGRGEGVSGRSVQVVDRGEADFDRDGRAETVAVVRCATGGGNPPQGIYVLARPGQPQQHPRIVETLLKPTEGMNTKGFAVRGDKVSVTLLGYSSPSVPRCCPDQERRVSWKWRNERLVLVPAPVAGSV